MPQCHINWDCYKSNMSKGFSRLQQQEEFVDMTLAADGHLVKVHKSIMALASPYIKSIILSAPCQHPIVFLTNIKHDILGYILEYVYTGEVLVPMDKMDAFIVAAKALHVTGVHNLLPPTMFRKHKYKKSEPTYKQEMQSEETSDNEVLFGNHEKHPDDSIGMENNCVKSDVISNSYTVYSHMATESSEYNAPSDSRSQANLKQEIVQATTSSRKVDTVTKSNLFSLNTEVSNLENLASINYNDLNKIIDYNNVQIPNIKNNVGKYPIGNIKTYATSKRKTINTDEVATFATENATNNSVSIIDIFEENDYNNEDVKAENNNMEIDSDENIQDWTISNKLDAKTTSAVESTANENYSINIEMRSENTGPPKITICSGVVENNPPVLSNSLMNIEPTENVAGEMPNANSDTMPKITIEAGTITNKPSISITKNWDVKPIDESTKTATNGSSPLYMQSTKGSLQMILNRFIYGVHYQTKKGKKLRWRCIDYRHKQCPAYVDTSGEVIICRKNAHKHGFHDDKILHKGSSKPVFESLGKLLESLTQTSNAAEKADISD